MHHQLQVVDNSLPIPHLWEDSRAFRLSVVDSNYSWY